MLSCLCHYFVRVCVCVREKARNVCVRERARNVCVRERARNPENRFVVMFSLDYVCACVRVCVWMGSVCVYVYVCV